jgi:two-component system OmpR family response regulator
MSHKKRILIIDDESSITRLLKLNLERTGRYEALEVNASARALPAALAFKPNLVLLDIMMPDLDGGDVAAQIQSEPTLRQTPIVFLTATVKPEELEKRGEVIGGFTYIAKPLNVRGVLAVIEKTIGV